MEIDKAAAVGVRHTITFIDFVESPQRTSGQRANDRAGVGI